MRKIKRIICKIHKYCHKNNFRYAGEIARQNKETFISFIKNGGQRELNYAIKVCDNFHLNSEMCIKIYNQKNF